MLLMEHMKKSFETVIGRARPSRRDLSVTTRPREPSTFRLKDDGVIPNNPRLPLIFYRTPVRLAGAPDPAATFEELFTSNGWGESWRNGIYDFVHYHSQTHEVLGIARGRGRVRIGGDRGRVLKIKAGDVIILPAGTGHQCLQSSRDLLVVGAYPPRGTYDECRGTAKERERALSSVTGVPVPAKDPVYGPYGPLRRLWQKQPRTSRQAAVA
jgi:uncharacterized protein YjlB